MNNIRIQQIEFKGKTGFGITNGKNWYFYYYTRKTSAESVVNSIIKTNLDVRQNIAHPKPVKFCNW